jgi:hypothetical protein
MLVDQLGSFIASSFEQLSFPLVLRQVQVFHSYS